MVGWVIQDSTSSTVCISLSPPMAIPHESHGGEVFAVGHEHGLEKRRPRRGFGDTPNERESDGQWTAHVGVRNILEMDYIYTRNTH